MNLQRLSNRAIELHRQGNLPEADRLYLQILSAQPGNFAARHMLGLIRYQQGHNNESLAHLFAALELNPGVAEAWSNYGLVLIALGRFEDALLSFDKALEFKPGYAEAFNNRGIALWHLKRFEEGLFSYDKALAIKPDYAEALNNQGNALRDQQRIEDALVSYDKALAINPNLEVVRDNRRLAEDRLEYFEKAIKDDCGGTGDFDGPDIVVFTNRAAVLRGRGQIKDALACLDKAIARRPNSAEALNDRGEILHRVGRREEALESFNKALMVQPDHLTALVNRGDAFRDLKRYAEALSSYERALLSTPDHVGALNSSGGVLRNLRRFDEALACFNKALAAKPNNVTALINRGTALWDLNRFEEAEASYKNALATEPGNVEALNNRGTVLWSLKRFGEALASYDRALAVNPEFVQALHNRGVILAEMTRFEEAIASYQKARILDPNHRNSLEGIAHAALHSCDWKRTAEISAVLKTSIVDQKALYPFVLLGYSSDPALQLQCAKNFINSRIPIRPPALWDGKPYNHDKIRVAYLSADYRKHATAYLMAELIESHDRSRFEIFGVSFGRDDGSNMRARLVKGFDKFIDVQFVSDSETAKLLRDLEVDIAVDLKGYTADQRPEILSYRPAPVQVNYLGYPGSLGAEFIDYVIADEIVAPFDQQAFFMEKIVHLPNCYQVNDSKRRIAVETPSRAEAGLPEEGFVFCCFNDNYKITAAMFRIWMRLLGSVPGSVLWLLATSADACKNLRLEAAARGIDPARLVFAPKLELSNHLARHRLADLFLDTLPCNAHTTTSDALWAGLPVVTCLGECFAGRVAASLLYAIGLAELVTLGLKDYADLALKLACDPPLLLSIRNRLERNRLTHPLFDTNRFRLNIEAAYTRMWEIAERGEIAQSFSIKCGEAR